MSKTSKDRLANLGCMVIRLFPKTMQLILTEYITPRGLKRKYLQKDFSFVFEENEAVLMDKLPNMDEFTIEICYKILRFENMLDEPKCKWGNIPHDTEIEIADDIQRIIDATNSIIRIRIEDVTAIDIEKMLGKIKLMVTRIDSFLEKDTLRSMYNSIIRCQPDNISILQDLTKIKVIEVATFYPDTESEERDMYSRLSKVIIETFPDILREVLRSSIDARQLYLKCFPYLDTFNPEQQVKLKELQYSNTYSSLDVTLIYRLLRQFSLIEPPTKGWGTFPDDVNTKLGDDVERIRCFRNQLVHRCDTNIDRNTFDEYFNKFRGICHRMDFDFFKNTKFEEQIVRHKKCRIDTEKYENAMKEIEHIRCIFEKKPIKFYWGDSFDQCLKNLRSLLKDAKLEGRQKIRVQIIFQSEDDVERNIHILNSIKEEINECLHGIELIVATEGSIVLIVDILQDILETDDKLQTTLSLFLEKILESISTFTTETIDMILLPVEEFTQWNKDKTIRKPVYLDFNIEAQLFETDDITKEQFGKIADVIFERLTGNRTNSRMTILPAYLEPNTTIEKSFIQAQTPVNYNLPVSAIIRQQLNITKSTNENPAITSCIKTGNTLVFTDYTNRRLILCSSYGTDMHHIPLSYQPCYTTEIDSKNVAVSCGYDAAILIINISTGVVTSTFKTSLDCHGISYNDNSLYVVIGDSNNCIHVMDLAGKVIRTIPLPSDDVTDITVGRDRLVCIDFTSIYCCSLDGTIIWKFENALYQDLRRVTTDDKRNVYVTDNESHSVVVISDNEKHFRKIVTILDGLINPRGIYFVKKENILIVCNAREGKILFFDVKSDEHK